MYIRWKPAIGCFCKHDMVCTVAMGQTITSTVSKRQKVVVATALVKLSTAAMPTPVWSHHRTAQKPKCTCSSWVSLIDLANARAVKPRKPNTNAVPELYVSATCRDSYISVAVLRCCLQQPTTNFGLGFAKSAKHCLHVCTCPGKPNDNPSGFCAPVRTQGLSPSQISAMRKVVFKNLG